MFFLFLPLFCIVVSRLRTHLRRQRNWLAAEGAVIAVQEKWRYSPDQEQARERSELVTVSFDLNGQNSVATVTAPRWSRVLRVGFVVPILIDRNDPTEVVFNFKETVMQMKVWALVFFTGMIWSLWVG
jgi:hypothetical protein